MLVEGIGGNCPNCGYNKMFQRYGSSGFWDVDACPKCGFAFGYAQGNEKANYGDECWKIILQGLHPMLQKDGFSYTRKGVFKFVEKCCRNCQDKTLNRANVFKYSKADVKKIMRNVKNKKIYGKEKVLFT